MNLPDLSGLKKTVELRKESSPLRLCTIPVFGSCGYDGISICDNKKDMRKINLEILYDNFKLDNNFVYISTYLPYPSFKTNDEDLAASIFKKHGKKKKKRIIAGKTKCGMMGNCVTFTYKKNGGKVISVKVFKNYRLHITGCKNFTLIEDFINEIVLPKIRSCSQKVCVHKKDGSLEYKEISCLDSPDIEYIKNSLKPAMYNTQFNANINIDKDGLYKVIEKISKEKPYYLPKGFTIKTHLKERYRGISLVLENFSKTIRVNILVFTNGSHIINGNVSMDDINMGHSFINHVFEENYDDIRL